MDILYMQQHAGRLLVLFHGLANIRAWMGAHIKDRPWMLELEQSGVKFVKTWGMQILHTAQSVLELFFGVLDRYHDHFGAGPAAPRADVRPLAPAPDALYATVLFAASVLLVSRYTMFLQFAVRDSVFLHTSSMLLRQLTAALDQLALGPEHAPRKAAAVVHELQRVWHDKVLLRAGDRSAPPQPARPLGAPAVGEGSGTPDEYSGGGGGGGLGLPISAERASAQDAPMPALPEFLAPVEPVPGVPDDQFFNWTGAAPAQAFNYEAAPPAFGAADDSAMMFFPTLDPNQFLDTGFWSLFSNTVDATAPQPQYGS
jgi:hypothetical protein